MKKPPQFLIIPYQIVEDSETQSLDERIYGVIYWLTQLRGERCVASNKTLAEVSKTTPKSLQNSLLRLEKRGYIHRKYYDALKKRREEIIPLIVFTKVSPVDDTKDEGVSSVDDGGVSSVDDQNNKSNLKKNSSDEGSEFSIKQEITKLEGSTRKDFKIIAHYLKEKNLNFDNHDQYITYFKRCLKAAKDLKGYNADQVQKTINHCRANYDEWTLETISKTIARVVNQ